MSRKAFRLILFAIVFMGSFISQGWSMEGRGYTNISMDQFVEMIKNKDFTLINVHIPYEGEIPETDLMIPFNAIDQHSDKLPQDKNAKIVVYCRTGSMSAIAAQTLVSMGYTNVFNFQGGMRAWKDAGRSLIFR